MKIFVLLFVVSCISAVIHLFFEKADRIRVGFYSLICYYLGFSFILSVAKYALGYHKENLVESFWDLQSSTLLHYGVPLIVIAVIAPIIVHLMFKGKEFGVISFFDSALCFCMAFMFFLVRVISNRSYIIAYVAAFIVTLLALMFKRVEKTEYMIDSGADKARIVKIVIMTLYWFITVAIYNPNELYLNNASEFPMSYWYFFGKLLLGSIIILAVLIVGEVLLLSKTQADIFSLALFFFVTLGYIQSMFFNGKMAELDGTNTASDLLKMGINLVVWLALGILLIISYKLRKETAEKVVRVVAIWISLIQIVSLLAVIITSDDTAAKSDTALTVNGRLEVGEENNIIMFVLDKYDRRIMDEILEDNPDFLEPLHDFTYYKNATSEFAYTNGGIPYLLSGTACDDDTTQSYVQYAYNNDDNLLNELYNSGYELGIYTDKTYVSEDLKDCIVNYEDGVVRTCDTADLVELMLQCSRYKMAPLVAKDYYVYSSSDVTNLSADGAVVNIVNDLPFYNSLLETGLSVNESNATGTFRFIHMYGAHPPYTMTEEFQYKPYDSNRDIHIGDMVSQAIGSMKIVYEYINQLKNLGKYDDATIIITADHGHNVGLYDEQDNITDISVPILLVKKPRETSEVITENYAQVSHEDLIQTIKKVANIPTGERTLSDISENEDRTRIFRMYNDDGYRKYEITGDVSDINSWRLIFER
jgi:hypothetical protein